MDQPYITMRVLDLIKLNYKIFISEQRKQQAEEMKQRSRRKR